MLDAVVVKGPVDFPFDGAIGSDDAYAAWMWMVRDLAPDLIDIEAIEDGPNNLAALESLMPELLLRDWTAVQVADLLAYLESLRGP